MGRVWAEPPLPHSRPNYLNLFPIPVRNLGRDELMCLVPVYNRLDNPIPIPNVFSGRGGAGLGYWVFSS